MSCFRARIDSGERFVEPPVPFAVTFGCPSTSGISALRFALVVSPFFGFTPFFFTRAGWSALLASHEELLALVGVDAPLLRQELFDDLLRARVDHWWFTGHEVAETLVHVNDNNLVAETFGLLSCLIDFSIFHHLETGIPQK